jgi:hypothetical protein
MKPLRAKYMEEQENTDARELAIHRRVSKLNYSRRCAEASAVQAYLKQGLPLAPGMEISNVIRDARRWVGSGSRENCIKVRCGLLWRASGEGLRRDGVCFFAQIEVER